MRSATARRPRGPRARARVAAVVSATGALLLAVTVVWQSASAGFTDATAPLGATVGTAVISLADDDAGARLLSVAGLKPGDSAEPRCLTVSSTSPRPIDVRMYVSGVTDPVTAGLLEVGVRIGTGGSHAGCAGFQPQAAVFAGRLSEFPTGWSSGQSSWNAPAAGDARTYEVTVSLAAAAPMSAQGRSVGVTFTWEGRTP